MGMGIRGIGYYSAFSLIFSLEYWTRMHTVMFLLLCFQLPWLFASCQVYDYVIVPVGVSLVLHLRNSRYFLLLLYLPQSYTSRTLVVPSYCCRCSTGYGPIVLTNLQVVCINIPSSAHLSPPPPSVRLRSF